MVSASAPADLTCLVLGVPLARNLAALGEKNIFVFCKNEEGLSFLDTKLVWGYG